MKIIADVGSIPTASTILKMKEKKQFPFRRGQRVRTKDTKRTGVVVSNGPATIGDPQTCRIPGGPLVFEGYVHVRFEFKNKSRICMEKIENLEKA